MAERDHEKEVLDEIVRRIVKVADPDKIILFGSRARGDAQQDSDYDILVIGPSQEASWRRAVPILMEMWGLPVSCDVLWRTPAEVKRWQEARSHVVSMAVREGRVVYERAA